MQLTDDDRDGLNVALNEATWCDLVAVPDRRRVAVGLNVLTLPAEGPAPEDTAVILLLDGVSRVAASLRHGRWDDASAQVEPLTVPTLTDAVRSFGGQALCGWEFVDPPADSWADWRDRLSLDAALSTEPAPHVLELFQESAMGEPRHLDVRVWFSELQVVRRTGKPVPLTEFVAGGRRWWDALYAGDPRTDGHGIVAATG